jgi:uncharacterized phage infection (PIP) family protein YhgE
MSDLKIDDGVLDSLKSGLASIKDQLQSSSSFASEIAGLVGDHDLAQKVADFSNSWSAHRIKMIDGVTKLHDQVVTIDEKFTDVDHQLSSALEKKD